MKSLYLTAAMMIALVASIAMPNTSHAQLNNIFSNSTESSSAKLDHSDLAKMLTESGLKFEKETETLFLVTAKHNDVKLPVYVYFSKDKSVVWIKINLSKLSGGTTQHTDKLLKLLELNGSYGEAFYSYNSNSTYLELYSMFRANSLDAGKLKQRIQAMAAQTLNQIDSWNADEWTTARHVGSWSAAVDANATMTIELRTDGSFALKNESAGQITAINGKYTISNGQLKMEDTQGNQIAGAIVFTDGNHFSLSVNNQDLKFERS